MKKNRTANSEAAELEVVQPNNYVVGLVSDSLSSNQTSAANDALSSLFSLTSPYSKPVVKVDKKSSGKKETSSVPSSGGNLKDKKPKKVKSLAEKKLEDREEALKNADDEDVQITKKSKVKRKAVKADNDEEFEDERGAKRRKTWNRVEERIKLKRTVFVGNLPVSCKKKDLKKIFKDLGAIESVRFRSVLREDPTMSRRLATIRRQIDPKKPSINAYVVFNDQEGAKNALQRNGMEIQKDFVIRVDSVTQHDSHDHKRSVFVGNLAYNVTELQFRQHFEECGEVEAVRLVRDKNTGVGKGFGYVLFQNTDAVMLALKLNNSELLGRNIRVKRSVKKEKVKNYRAPGRGGNARAGRDAGNKHGPKHGHFRARKSFKKSPGASVKTSGNSFRGKMSDPTAKKNKGQKQKFKPRKSKTVHI